MDNQNHDVHLGSSVLTTGEQAKAGYTPGPWKLLPLEEDKPYLRVRGTQLSRRFKVCNVHAPFQHLGAEVLESQANARLIAAAPDLLDACKSAERWLEGWASAEPYLAVIRAAIAKAGA